MLPGTSPILNIAHRGFSARYPENSLLAFEEAIKAGASGFECDLRLSSDGEIIIFHDESLDRLCGIPGRIEDSSWKFLSNLRVKQQEPLCRLEDALRHFSHLQLNLEIKASNQASLLVEKLIPLLTKNYPAFPILISSFDFDILRHAHELIPGTSKLRLGYIFYKLTDSTLENIQNAKWLYSLHPHFEAIKDIPSHIQLPLWTWTPNNAQTWTSILAHPHRIEAFITDEPSKLYRFLNPPLNKVA